MMKRVVISIVILLASTLAQGESPTAPAVKVLEYKEMEPFFVTGAERTGDY